MSLFYKKNNREAVINLFGKSILYDQKMLRTRYRNLKPFEYNEHYLYGRVNRDYVPIEINLPSVSLKGIQSTTDSNRSIQAISFVVDAFNELSAQFDKKAATGEIDNNDQYLSKLQVVKAYENPRVLYNRHLATIKKKITEKIRKDNITFSNFNQFLNEVVPIILQINKLLPMTYPGFLKSKFCPVTVSGMVIEIADLDSSNDEEKIRKFKNSKNWDFYLNACQSYGFSVDMNNPWRLVADIGSSEMLKYSANYGYQETNSVLQGAFIESYKSFVPTFRTILLEIYNSSKRVFSEVECIKGVFTRNKVITPVEYSFDKLGFLISDAEIINIYMAIRFAEDETNFHESELLKIKKHIRQLTQLRGLLAAVKELEIIIAPTFNESGSLTDARYRAKLRKQEELDVLSNTWW